MTQNQIPAPRRYLGKSPIVCDAVLSALRAGNDIATAARIVGLSRSAIHLWRKSDPDFDRAVTIAKQAGVAKVVGERLRGAQAHEA